MMADNVTVEPAETGIEVATDEIGGVHYPIYKSAIGADGAITLVDSDNGMPISSPESGPAYTRDEQLLSVLQGITKELRIMNIHLSMITDNEVTKAELD